MYISSALIMTLVIIVAAFWVYFDASKNRIGVIRGDKVSGSRGASPTLWGLLTLLLFIISFPYYLIRRRQLITLAQTSPVESGRGGLVPLILVSAIMIYYTL